MEERRIIWQPNPGPQTDFLEAPEEELGYGGAAGGGKTDGLVIDALGLWQGAIEHPDYEAIIFRRTFPELSQIIDRSHELYPGICGSGSRYNSTEHQWTFPSGAHLTFAFAENPVDKYRYQGKAFQYIGWEELTQWPTDEIYRYLLSRLRTKNPRIRPLVRSTFNPGGVGHKWVQERFAIPDDGSATRQTVTVEVQDDAGETRTVRMRRRFIPARLSDNPHLGIEYRAQLMQMDENERKALLDGRWDVQDIPGQIYKNELQLLYSQGRVTSVPVDRSVPVHTVWDLGMRDSTSIWFIQRAGSEWHWVDYFEASGEGLPFYAKVLQDRGYTYGTHIAPHDIQVRELGTGRSRLEVARTLGIHFQIAPDIGVEDGIHALRMMLPNSWFDRDRCSAGLDGLKNYRRDYNAKMGEFKPTPVHDWASHPADAGRMAAAASHLLRDSSGMVEGVDYAFF